LAKKLEELVGFIDLIIVQDEVAVVNND